MNATIHINKRDKFINFLTQIIYCKFKQFFFKQETLFWFIFYFFNA